MKLATTTGDFAEYTVSQADALKYIEKSGFKYIDYNFGIDYRDKSGFYSEDAGLHLENMLKTADELSVEFVQAHAPMGKPLENGTINMEHVSTVKNAIKYCSKLGIKNIVVHSGYEQGISKKENFERNREFYLRIFDVAEDYKVNVLTENFNKMMFDDVYWIDSAEDLFEFIEFAGHPFLHACWDAGHGNMQELGQCEALKILGKHVYGIHVQDNYGDHDSHIAPFFGSLNIDSLMHGLMDIGYAGYFTFEASRMFYPSSKRRQFSKDERLIKAPLDLRIEAEKLLYKTGKCILSAYECFEV